jgi:hypothetical protein
MPISTKGHDGPQHRQPQKQEVRQFIGPEDRAIESVTAHHASEQNEGLGHDDRGAHALGNQSDAAVQQKRRMSKSRTVNGAKGW